MELLFRLLRPAFESHITILPDRVLNVHKNYPCQYLTANHSVFPSPFLPRHSLRILAAVVLSYRVVPYLISYHTLHWNHTNTKQLA